MKYIKTALKENISDVPQDRLNVKTSAMPSQRVTSLGLQLTSYHA